jgi:hypothetical protein
MTALEWMALVALAYAFMLFADLRVAGAADGGIEHEIAVDDRRPVDSDQVNDYLRDAMGSDFTAKDFRTWGATMRAAELLGRTPLPELRSERALKDCETAVVRIVAQELRNTPAVCRKSYINPVAFQCWRPGRLQGVIADLSGGSGRKSRAGSSHRAFAVAAGISTRIRIGVHAFWAPSTGVRITRSPRRRARAGTAEWKFPVAWPPYC